MRHTTVFLLAMAGSLAACSGSQSGGERGEVFCESYENSFTGQCRNNCESTTDGKREEVGKQCEAKCNEDLKSDDTFSSDCGERAAEL